MANKLTHTTISSPNGINEVCSMMTIDTVSNPFVFHNILLPTETEYVYTTYVKSSVAGSITVGGNSVSTTTSWDKKVIPFSNTNASNKNLQISFGTAGTYYFYHTKLETGNLSTHYSSAPEDGSDTLQHIQTVAEQTADGFKWLVNGSQETGFYISDGGIEAITEKFTIKGSDGSKTVINGGHIEAGSIIGNDIKANTITAREITAENISGTNGWINLSQGTFDYGNGKLSWNGSTLNIDGNGSFSGTINATSGSFSGTVNASAGSFSGWTITSDGLKRASAATQTAYTDSNPSGTTQNFWSTWFDFSKINKWNDTTASGGSGQTTLNTGDMYFGNSGLAISSNFTVDSSGYMKSKSGEIGGFTIDSSKISFSNSGTSTSGYLSSSDSNFIYVNKGNSTTYDKFYVTNTGTLTLEHQATESISTEDGETKSETKLKRTLLENGNVRTSGFLLCGGKTTEWMDGNAGIRLHPEGTLHIQRSAEPQIILTKGTGTGSTVKGINARHGIIQIASKSDGTDKALELVALADNKTIKFNCNRTYNIGEYNSDHSDLAFTHKNGNYSIGFGIGSSKTSRGIYDYTSNQWSYYINGENNVFIQSGKTENDTQTFGNVYLMGKTTSVSGLLYLEGHSGNVGNVSQGANSTAVNISAQSWANRGTLTLSAGTWVISAHVTFAEASSWAGDGTVQVCLSTNSASSTGELPGTRNVLICPSGYITGHVLGTTGIFSCTTQTNVYVNAYSRYARSASNMSYRIVRIA